MNSATMVLAERVAEQGMGVDDDAIQSTLFAVRISGREGWIIDEQPGRLAEIDARLRAEGHDVQEIREISWGVGRRRDERDTLDVGGLMLWLARGAGFSYDTVAKCWRGPGETVTEPAGAPERTEVFSVRDEPPKFGWWPIVIRADDSSAEIDASSVYDPTVDLLRWLERIVAGESARLLIDEESPQTELIVYPKADGLVRLLVIRHGEGGRMQIDALIKTSDLVGEFYRTLRALAEDREAYVREWLEYGTGEGAMAPDLASPRIEDFLRRSAYRL